MVTHEEQFFMFPPVGARAHYSDPCNVYSRLRRWIKPRSHETAGGMTLLQTQLRVPQRQNQVPILEENSPELGHDDLLRPMPGTDWLPVLYSKEIHRLL